jgi:hypothetical protein
MRATLLRTIRAAGEWAAHVATQLVSLTPVGPEADTRKIKAVRAPCVRGYNLAREIQSQKAVARADRGNPHPIMAA